MALKPKLLNPMETKINDQTQVVKICNPQSVLQIYYQNVPQSILQNQTGKYKYKNEWFDILFPSPNLTFKDIFLNLDIFMYEPENDQL